MNDDKHKVSFRVETKRDTFYDSWTQVLSEEDLQNALGFIGRLLDQDHGYISVVEEGGHEIFIPREEIATIIICKDEAEDE